MADGMSSTSSSSSSSPLARLMLVTAWACMHMAAVTTALQTGDFVPMARRGQFHGTRTHWHDALGRHCPRFGVDRSVALPIPKPLKFSAGDTYKLALSFDHDKFITPWHTVLAAAQDNIPVIELHFTYSGGEIKSLRSQLTELPSQYATLHREIVAQHSNATHWPKHVILNFRWQHALEMDVSTGLFVLFGSGLALAVASLVIVTLKSKDKLVRFMSEAVGDAPVPKAD